MNHTPKPVEFEEFTFSAPSDTYGEPPYLVDLEAHNGDGECACKDWDINRRFLRKQGEDNLDKIQCKHIKRSLIEWACMQNPTLRKAARWIALEWAREEIKKRVKKKRRELRRLRESKA